MVDQTRGRPSSVERSLDSSISDYSKQNSGAYFGGASSNKYDSVQSVRDRALSHPIKMSVPRSVASEKGKFSLCGKLNKRHQSTWLSSSHSITKQCNRRGVLCNR